MLQAIRDVRLNVLPGKSISLADIAIVLVTSVFCLHTLREISPAYPLVAWTMAFAGCFLAKRPTDIDRLGLFALASLLAALAYGVAISFVQFPDENYFLAIARLGFIAPYALFVALVIDTRERMRLALKTFALWTVVAGATIIYQNSFGAIDWFAEPSVRAGAIRYASLAGSLTVYGVVGVLALPVIYYMFGNHPFFRGMLIAILLVALLMSLQKAAVINVVLFWAAVAAFSLFSFIRGRPTLPLRHILTTVSCCCCFAILLAGSVVGTQLGVNQSGTERSAIVATIDNVVRLDPSAQNDDVSVVQSVIDRFGYLPLVLFEKYGLTNLLVGVGLVGASGTLGFDGVTCINIDDVATCVPRYPMAHNGLVELMAIGGLPLLLSFLAVFSFAACRAIKLHLRYMERRMYVGLIILLGLILVNAPFTSGILSQPYMGGIFFASVIPLLVRKSVLRDT